LIDLKKYPKLCRIYVKIKTNSGNKKSNIGKFANLLRSAASLKCRHKFFYLISCSNDKIGVVNEHIKKYAISEFKIFMFAKKTLLIGLKANEYYGRKN